MPDDAVEVRVPMRDGVELAADLYGAGDEPRPVVLVRLPYDKDGEYCFMPPSPGTSRGAGIRR